jgi:uncharacterized protein YmfQ (DUF2313 family)
MYGQSLYGIALLGIDPGNESDAEILAPDLMEHLPPCFAGIREMEEIQRIDGEEIGLIQFAIKDILDQWYVRSATWGLDFWERELGIGTDYGKPYPHRREIIAARLQGAGTATKALIKSVAAAFSGGDVDVIEYPAEYRFEVQFIGVMGIPPNMAGLIQAIEDIKPAHLACSFKYTYTWWLDLQSLTWQQAGIKTWNELRIYEGA